VCVCWFVFVCGLCCYRGSGILVLTVVHGVFVCFSFGFFYRDLYIVDSI